METSKPLGGTGPGAGKNARQLATERELRRVSEKKKEGKK